MKNKRAVIKNCLLYISLIIISVLIELFVFNFKLLTLDSKTNGIHTLNNYDVKVVDKKRIISFDVNDRYVSKLKIKYKCKDDIKTVIEYISKDYYKKNIKKQIEDSFDSQINLQVLNIKNVVNRVNIIIDKNADITISSIKIDNNIKISYFRIVFVFVFFLVITLIIKYYKENGETKNLHKEFLLIGLLMGCTLILLQPSITFQSWDDQIHFQNSYQLFGNEFKWSAGEVSMIDGLKSDRKWTISSIEEQENITKHLTNDVQSNYKSKDGLMIKYNQIAYIPSAIGYHVCKLLRMPFSICFKMGKFLNLFAYLLIMSYAIKISRCHKKLLCFIGLMPSNLFLACQYSYDPAVISGLTLGMVVLFNWFSDIHVKVDFKNMLIFICAMLYACLTKAIYFPLLLLFLFIPSSRFETKKQEIWIKSMIIFICILLLSTFALPSDLMSTNTGDLRGGETNVAEQLKLIISHPIGYLNVLRDTALSQFGFKLLGNITLGGFSYLGGISDNIYYVLLLVLLFIFCTNDENSGLNIKNRLLMVGIIVSIILLIWTALYLSYTPVGLNTINGVQNRYFIPLLFPLIVSLQFFNVKTNIGDNHINIMILLMLVFAFMFTLYKLIIIPYCI